MLHLLWDPRHPWVVCSKGLTYLWWDCVLSVWNICVVGEKGSATHSSRKRRARWHLVPSFHRDGVSFAPVADLALAVSQSENFLALQQTEKFLQDASHPWAQLETTEAILHQLRRLQKLFFYVLMKYNKCRICWCTSEAPVPLAKVFISVLCQLVVQGWELPFTPCHCSDSAYSPDSSSKDINLLSSKCLKNDKMLFTWAGSITCCLSEEIFSKGAFVSTAGDACSVSHEKQPGRTLLPPFPKQASCNHILWDL